MKPFSNENAALHAIEQSGGEFDFAAVIADQHEGILANAEFCGVGPFLLAALRIGDGNPGRRSCRVVFS